MKKENTDKIMVILPPQYGKETDDSNAQYKIGLKNLLFTPTDEKQGPCLIMSCIEDGLGTYPTGLLKLLHPKNIRVIQYDQDEQIWMVQEKETEEWFGVLDWRVMGDMVPYLSLSEEALDTLDCTYEVIPSIIGPVDIAYKQGNKEEIKEWLFKVFFENNKDRPKATDIQIILKTDL